MLLLKDARLHLLLLYLLLGEALNCVEVSAILDIFDEEHLSELSFSQFFEILEIFEVNFVFGGGVFLVVVELGDLFFVVDLIKQRLCLLER